MSEWRRALEELKTKDQGEPNAALTVAQMAGDPPDNDPARQARTLPQEVLTDIEDAARKAIMQIPQAGVPESIYTEIKQGPSEPFTSSIDRLTQAVDRQVNDEGMKPHLFGVLHSQMPTQNANASSVQCLASPLWWRWWKHAAK